MAIFNTVYGGSWGGWKPWVNTLIYYPLTSDLVDVMWNWNTGTATWNVTFNANPWSTTWCYVQWQNNIYVTGLSLWVNGKSTVTLNYWANFVSLKEYAALVWHNGNYDNQEPTKLISERGFQFLWCKWSNWNCYTDAENIPLNSWYHNFGFAIDNWTIKMYIDGQKVSFKSWLYSYNIWTVQNWTSELQLGYWWTYWTSRTSTWYVRDYIVETIAWSEDDFLNYYNQTKKKFWL